MNPPKKVTFIIALVLAAAAILSYIGVIPSLPVLGGNELWFMTAAWGLLFLGCLFKGL